MPDRLNAGDLRARVVIQTTTATADNFGQTTANSGAWSTVATVWASVSSISGKDMYALGSGFTSQVSHKIAIRFQRPLLASKQQILYDNRTFDVEAALDPDGLQEQIWFICMERNNS